MVPLGVLLADGPSLSLDSFSFFFDTKPKKPRLVLLVGDDVPAVASAADPASSGGGLRVPGEVAPGFKLSLDF